MPLLSTQDSALGTFLTLAMVMGLPGCLGKPPPFDEAKWLEEVTTCNTDLLYAPHYKDGRFFNPWMPWRLMAFLGC